MSRTRHLTVVDGPTPTTPYGYLDPTPMIAARPALERVRLAYLPKSHPAQSRPGSPVERWLLRLDRERELAAEQLADEVSQQL